MTTTSERALRLRPEFEVIPLDGDAVLLRSPDQGVRVRVEGTSGVELADVLRRLDGTRPLGAVLDGRDSDDGFQALLRGLVARGIVDADPAPVPQADLGRFFSQFHDDPAACTRRLETSRVVVVGGGVLAECVGRELRAAGVGRLVTAENARESAEALAGACSGADLVVCADVSPAADGARAVNRWALDARLPWLAVRVFGKEGFVGPLFVPGEGPCHACLLGREEANWVDPDLTRAYLHRIGAAPASLAAYGQLPILTAVVGQWAALEAIKLLSGFTVAALLGSVLRVDVIGCRTQLHRVLRLPRCPECSPLAQRPGVSGLLYGGSR